jgi:hypothetical protein
VIAADTVLLSVQVVCVCGMNAIRATLLCGVLAQKIACSFQTPLPYWL